MKKWFRHNFKSIFYSVFRQLLLVFFAIGIATIILYLTGYEPVEVFVGLSRAITKDIGGTIRWTTPLILCGLAIAVTFRVGVFNLGVDGQLILSSIAATAIALYIGPYLPPVLTILLAFLCGILAAVIWALIPGILLVRFGTDEVVITLMLNYIAIFLTDFLVLGPMKGTGATSQTDATNSIAQNLWLPNVVPSSLANIGIFLAIPIALVIAYIIFQTKLGYEFKIVGDNPIFAKYGGIKSKSVVLKAFIISGLIAGIAGVIEILGVHHRFPRRFNAGLGFDGVVVSLLAQNHPIGSVFSGFLFGALRNGAINMERITDVPRAMVDIIQSVIILVVTAQFTINFIKKKRGERKTIEGLDKEN